MATSRSISPEAWAHAREGLIFYFSRRHGMDRAEDLAHETLMAVWSRSDYQFEKDEDFPKVCLGFARHVSRSTFRDATRRPTVSLEGDTAASDYSSEGAKSTEMRILLEQIKEMGKAGLSDREWQLIVNAAGLTGDNDARGDADAAEELRQTDGNRFRVYLHRARKKLEKMSGWREGKR